MERTCTLVDSYIILFLLSSSATKSKVWSSIKKKKRIVIDNETYALFPTDRHFPPTLWKKGHVSIHTINYKLRYYHD